MSTDNIIRTTELPFSNKYRGGVGYFIFNHLKGKRGSTIIGIDGTTGETDTVQSLLTKCIRASLILRKRGIKEGDIVTAFFNIQLNACVPCIASYFVGAIPAFTDTAIDENEVIHQISICEPKVIITYDDPNVIAVIKKILKTLNREIEVIVLDVQREFQEPQKEELSFEPIFVDDLQQTAAIFFSSGSTGFPKAICLSHYSIFDDVLLRGIPSSEKEPMVILGYDNYYWLVETWKLLGIVASHGIRLVSSDFDADEVWKLIDKYKVTMLFLCVKEVKELCESTKPANMNVDSVKALCVVGDRLPVPAQRSFKKLFPQAYIPVIYGLTETGICTHFTYGNPKHMELMEKHPESVGVPVEGSGVAMKVVNVDTGKTLGPHQPGELRVKIRTLLNCYHNMLDSDHLDEDGWFKTGDIMKYDEDQCFYIEGRIKDIIMYQGWHVCPGIIETKLKSHPAVKRAAVVGKPDPVDGEHILALVELTGGYQTVDLGEVERYVNNDMNDIYKIRGGVVVVERLPTTITGKVKKMLLKEMLSEGRI